MKSLRLTISLADQRFDRAKSIGIFNVSLGLCRALAQRSEIQRLSLLVNRSLQSNMNFGSAVVKQCLQKSAGKLWRFWWDQFGVYRAARQTGDEWLLLPKGYAPLLRRSPARLVTYIHDAMHEHYKKNHSHGFPLFENSYFHAGFCAAIKQSEIILTNTQFTAAEIQSVAEHYGLGKPCVEVVGIGFERPPQTPPVTRKRIIILASRWPHKRTDLAIRYVSRWQEQRKFSSPVDWIGQMPDGLDFPQIANWHLHSRIAQDDMNRLLTEAQALLYFSDYEGFGMPPVEAAMSGACPVYSDIPATREVMQNAGCCFANSSYESFATALDQALCVPEQQVKQWAEELLQRHDWQTVAERVVQALK